MKLSTLGVAGISTLLGLALMSAVIAAEPGDGGRRPAFQGGRGPGPGGMMGGGRGGFRRGPAFERQLERMDTNEDDQVSEDEFVDFRLARVDDMFERRDRDDDGLISLEENERPDRPDRPNRPEIDREEVIACVRETIADFAPNADMDREERFENVDTDGNGSLSLAEVSTALETRAHEAFAKIDADDSGFITEEELKARNQDLLNVRRVVRACIQELAQA
jgi:Ca2+-binding EF-hand superfamily protein